jgi:hypothetical protein
MRDPFQENPTDRKPHTAINMMNVFSNPVAEAEYPKGAGGYRVSV